ncbi:MAG TPA: response regulator [Xanthomonadales bacterium]|nr:response regulator [Xanthomonadales bacterium]
MNNSTGNPNKIHPLLGRSYWARVFAYVAASLLVFKQVPADQPWLQYLVLFIGFIYPTLFYHLGVRAKNTRLVGIIGYYLDTAIWSLAVVFFHYSIVLLLLIPLFSFVTSILMLGVRRAMPTTALMAFILLSGLYIEPVELFEGFSTGQAIFGWAMALVFMLYIALLVNGTTRSFVTAKHQLEARNRKIREQSDQLAAMTYVSQLVNSTLDLDEIMVTIMRSLNSVFNFNLMAILFLDDKRRKLQLDRMIGDLSDDLKDSLEGLDIPMSETNSVFTRTIEVEKPIYLADVSEDIGAAEGVSKIIYQRVPAKSMLTFPLRRDGDVEGVLVFANTRDRFELDDENIKVIGRYVTYIVSAIRNARNYQTIQDARAAADAANSAKSQFLANMSHELRTPLNAVIGYTEMLQEEAEDLGLKDMIPDFEKVKSASHHLLHLISEVLDLAKIEADRIELNPETIQLEEFLMDVQANVEPLIAKNRNELRVTARSELGEVFLDRLRIQQVVLNLLSNAAKFTHKGDIELIADRFSEHDFDWLIFKVSDSGIGMTDEQLEQVFEPFAQADSSTTREFGGTGLGLSISRQICELMGGSLTAESEKDRGSTFTVRIPVKSTGIRKDIVDAPEGLPAAGSGHPKDSRPGVLLIDDDTNILDLMTRMLKRAGYTVVTATTGEEGLKTARELRPGVIVLDVMLPSMDGWSVLTKLKSDPELCGIPVVMQSILDESQKGYMLGATEYLTKPVERRRVIDIISKLKRDGENQRVLIVEDDSDTREMMALWLKNAGWKVTTAVDGREGLEAWDSAPADLIILDLLMPNMDGFEFMEEMRDKPGAANARVIVITAKDLTREDLTRLKGSVERIIQKTSRSTDEILSEVGRHLTNCQDGSG